MAEAPKLYLNPTGRERTALFLRVAAVTHLFLDGVDQGAASMLVVPAGVSSMRLTGTGAGGGGGGGFASAGGGGGGGGGGMAVRDLPLIVVPGSTLTATLGVAGAGGAAGAVGAAGGESKITGMLFALGGAPGAAIFDPGMTYPDITLWPGNGGAAGAAVNGGSGGGASYGNVGGGTGGAGAGPDGSLGTFVPDFWYGSGGGAGGAVTFSGGRGLLSSSALSIGVSGAIPSASAGNGTNGGGGGGGRSLFSGIQNYGKGGVAGGAAAQVGIMGGGGGGGAGGAAGFAGGDGFMLLTWVSPW